MSNHEQKAGGVVEFLNYAVKKMMVLDRITSTDSIDYLELLAKFLTLLSHSHTETSVDAVQMIYNHLEGEIHTTIV